jgi:L-ascorbate metabolism protein UlaG (beta-lactamase superfamily)
MAGEVVFQWLGTAGFRIRHHGKVLLVDPYLTRNERAVPVQSLRPADMADTDFIFVSHGHFDHLFDVPAIVDVSRATVHCNKVAAKTLQRRGVSPAQLTVVSGGKPLDFGTFKVSVALSKHIRFDMKLILDTIPGVLRDMRSLRQLERSPAGTVLITVFDFDGLAVMHVGSMGLTPEEAGTLGLGTPDILMLPLQGHTDICRLAAEVTAAIEPRAVIPQHHDNFFPPISRTIDLEPFRKMTEELLPECSYYEPRIDREFTPAEVFSEPGGAPVR